MQPCAGFTACPYLVHALQVRELSLSGNQLRFEMLRDRLRFAAGDSLTNTSCAGSLEQGATNGWSGTGPAAYHAMRGEAMAARPRQGAQPTNCSGEQSGRVEATLLCLGCDRSAKLVREVGEPDS